MDGTGYQSGPASLFVSIARNTSYTVICKADCRIGAYPIHEGEKLNVLSDGDGLFSVYVEWGEGAIARLNANDINKLAGWDVLGIGRSPAHYVGGAQ